MNLYSNYIKRIMDLLLSLSAFLILLPVFVVVVFLLLIQNNGKPFFYQNRPGKNNAIFRIIKFKTMNDKTDNEGNLLPAYKRITLLGSFIRKTSLDELPQLINVIKGDMSLIGPRPLRVEYLPLYSEYQIRRHCVRPGITGWAQVNGRNAIDWDKKFELDVFYVENISFKLDCKIIFATLIKVIKKENVNVSNTEIIKPFKNIKLDS